MKVLEKMRQIRINWEFDKGCGVRCPGHVAGWVAMSQALGTMWAKAPGQ